MMNMTKSRGFTLVEMLAAIIIIAVLAATSIPALTGLYEKSKKIAYIEEARIVRNAAQIYILDQIVDGNTDFLKISKDITSTLHPIGDPENPLTAYVDHTTPGAAVRGIGICLYNGKVTSLTYIVNSFVIEIIDGRDVKITKIPPEY